MIKKANKKTIGYSKERVVLSDILPYEVPPYFSNRYLYNFLVSNKVCLISNELRFKKDSTETLEKVIKLLFGISSNKQKCIESNYDFFKVDNFATIPFTFRISHKNNDYRELSVAHPINQLQIIEFYDKYKYTIKYVTNISKFSLRKPHKVASLKFFKDKTHSVKVAKNEELSVVESSDKEYTSLKTFFSYKNYSNIFEFYESYEYQRAEKKFDNLLKFDISRCFDSIYTHSITWALSNKRIVKEYIKPKYKTTFGHKFDELMQKLNYNETNGIIIGPEFSRIFAEIILQHVDKEVEKKLYKLGQENDSSLFEYKKGYDIFRYVDDFFVFYSDDAVKTEILRLYKIELQKYNLYFNESKTETFEKPIITNITIAKEEIRRLVEHSMVFRLDRNDLREQIGIKYFSSKDIITNYKVILASTNTSYKDLQNYFLVIIFNKVKEMISKLGKEQNTLLKLYKKEITSTEPDILDKIDSQKLIVKKYYKSIFDNINEILELVFFIYTVLPRVSYSIKLSHILFRIIDFIKNQEKTKQRFLQKGDFTEEQLEYFAFEFDEKHTVFKKIFDSILLVFSKSKSIKYAEIETLYLLPIVSELGDNYMLSGKLLDEYFRISENGIDNNYFMLISILNHIKRDNNYSRIKSNIQRIIRKKMSSFESQKAEDIFLLIDILVCPYIGNSNEEAETFRLKILDKIGFFDDGTTVIDKKRIMQEVKSFYNNGFYNWKVKDFGVELNTKRGHNVY